VIHVRSGLLVIDKPAGPTSFGVVKRAARALGLRSAGHAGTLDPAATGVLVVCVGDALKLQQFLSDGDKAYEATVAFGAATETEDGEGAVTARGDPSGLDADAVRAALPRFLGEVAQVPPMYSAVRIGGRRLHEAARAGEAVERTPRTVRIHALELLGWSPAQDGLAHARLAVRCGKGTYVRTLAADLGRALGVPAHLAVLRRTEASGFGIAESLPLERVEALARAEGSAALAARLIPPAEALRAFPAVACSAGQAWDLAHGRAPVLTEGAPPEGTLVRALTADGRLAAVCRAERGRLQPVRGFLTPADLGGQNR
jgi:tRNA pseudouridine55 synthase